MPPRTRTAAKNSNLLLFTTQMQLSSLPEDSKQCPICQDDYADHGATLEPDGTQEKAVRVDLSATNYRSLKLCGHIFGKRCLEKHIAARAVWHNKCPLCRCLWFMESDLDVTIVPATEPRPPANRTLSLSRLRSRLRLPSRNTEDSEDTRASSEDRGRGWPEVGLLQKVHDSFSYAVRGSQLNGTVEDVEKVLVTVYGKIQSGTDNP